MKKLIKPTLSIEQFSEEMVQAFCEHDGCKENCKGYCTKLTWDNGVICKPHCDSVKGLGIDDDILF